MPSLLKHGLTLLLVGLLALGPFLHGHFGNHHASGFHLDGVHAVHTAGEPAATTLAEAQPCTDQDESQALGVAESLPQTADHGLPVLIAGLLSALLILPSLRCPACPLGAQPRTHLRKLYRAGLPPPCLAPPAG